MIPISSRIRAAFPSGQTRNFYVVNGFFRIANTTPCGTQGSRIRSGTGAQNASDLPPVPSQTTNHRTGLRIRQTQFYKESTPLCIAKLSFAAQSRPVPTSLESEENLRIIRSMMKPRTNRPSRTPQKHFILSLCETKHPRMQIPLVQHHGFRFGLRDAITQAKHLATEVAA